MTIRVLLADDHQMFRETLVLLLKSEPEIQVLGGADDGKELLALLKNIHPDILLLDIGLPDVNGIDLTKQIRSQYPNVAIIALSGYADRFFVEEMLSAGAVGYVLKSASSEELIKAIHAVSQGQFFCSSEVAATLMKLLPNRKEKTPPCTVLGKREREILALVAKGKSSVNIAEMLSITVGTVNVHRRNIKAKVGLRAIADLTRYAIREGLVSSN